MKIESNGHVYDTSRSMFLGVRKYGESGKITVEKLYQTVSGAYFIYGRGGKYVHTEGNFFSRRKIYEMILPKDKHFAEKWLKEHCNRDINEKNEKVYIHPLISASAKSQLLNMSASENCGLGEMIEKLIERV